MRKSKRSAESQMEVWVFVPDFGRWWESGCFPWNCLSTWVLVRQLALERFLWLGGVLRVGSIVMRHLWRGRKGTYRRGHMGHTLIGGDVGLTLHLAGISTLVLFLHSTIGPVFSLWDTPVMPCQ